MSVRMKYAAFLACLAILTGCGPKTRYVWKDYDTELYDYYEDPTKKDAFALALKEILEDSEPQNRVPPGIYAEYGFLMYEKGDMARAILYYQKESDKWPESKPLMAKMITNTRRDVNRNGNSIKEKAGLYSPVPGQDNPSSQKTRNKTSKKAKKTKQYRNTK